MTSMTLPNGLTQTYSYDEAGQLTQISYRKGETTLGAIHYAYDADGATKATWGSFARLALPDAIESASYDAANRLVKRDGEELAYDKAGNLVEDGESEYEWDARGQLEAIEGPSEASFAYDPFGRRISKSFGEASTALLYDGPNVAQEYEGEELAATVLSGLEADRLFSRAGAAGEDSYLTDRLGSAIALADSEGNIDTTYSYEPFGAPTAEGEATDNPFGFTGREYDPTALQYNRARYYDPSAARFISRDPAGLAGSGPNLYWYAEDSPLNFTDPSGLGPCVWGFVACDEDDDPCASIASGPMIVWCAAPDEVAEPISDASAGYGDAASFGATKKLREALGHHVKITNSGLYETAGLLGILNREVVLFTAPLGPLAKYPVKLKPTPQVPRDLPERWQGPPRDLDPVP
jgi:RHS repeat-associated protein